MIKQNLWLNNLTGKAGTKNTFNNLITRLLHPIAEPTVHRTKARNNKDVD